MLPMNEAITDKKGGLKKLFNETALVDAFTKLTELPCNISTYV
jgi:hypothetical protein